MSEAKHINKSLSALGDVINALSGQDASGRSVAHVPYRNSKLTYLLQRSLSGGSKVLMFVNASPVRWNADETVNSLQFARRCHNVQLKGGPGGGGGGGAAAAAEVRSLQGKVRRLEEMLRAARQGGGGGGNGASRGAGGNAPRRRGGARSIEEADRQARAVAKAMEAATRGGGGGGGGMRRGGGERVRLPPSPGR